MSDWFKQMPVYVTRKTADGMQGDLYIAIVWVFLITLIIAANIIGWGIYGILELIGKL